MLCRSVGAAAHGKGLMSFSLFFDKLQTLPWVMAELTMLLVLAIRVIPLQARQAASYQCPVSNPACVTSQATPVNMIGMQVAYAAVSSAARVVFLGFTSAGSVLSSVVSGILVFWLWWATTSPIRQSARANGPHAKGSRSTQQQGETEAGQPKGGADRSTISADTNSPSALSRAEALQVARTAREEHAADRVCDGHGLEDVLDDGAYVSPLGNRLRVSADCRLLVLDVFFHITSAMAVW
jgi:hypothetical protein